MQQFETQVELNITGPKGGTGLANIKWSLDFDMKERGLQGLIIAVPDQKISAMITKYDPSTDEEFEIDVEFDLKNIEVDEYLGEIDDISNINLMPRELEIHTKRSELKFY